MDHLDQDISEKTNLAKSSPEIAGRLKKELDEWSLETEFGRHHILEAIRWAAREGE